MDYRGFVKSAQGVTGVALPKYKEKQMKRRIEQLMERWGVEGYSGLLHQLRRDEERLDDFLNYLTINTSEFFRNAETFLNIEHEVLPELVNRRRANIWSAGCSVGAEIYSIAIQIEDNGWPTAKFRLVGTDIDKVALDKAREGLYSQRQVKNVPSRLLKSYFSREGNGYRLNRSVRKMVSFRYHDLLRHPYQKGWDLIMCRNVFIYFSQPTQKEVLKMFHDSLSAGGCLVVGATEILHGYKEVGFARKHAGIYSKLPT